MNKYIFLALVNLYVLAFNHTYYPLEFISDVELQITNEPLKTSIHSLLTRRHTKVPGSHDLFGCSNKGKCYSHKKLNYRDARTALFGQLHLERDKGGEYFVHDVYCDIDYYSSSKVGRIGPNKIPNHTVINCEHTWPQSKFNHYSRYQKSDLHHLFPTNSRANSIRDSHDFGEIKSDRGLSRECTSSQYENRNFEPPKKHKGNVARAMFYFAVRYKMTISRRVESTLRKWHESDPVDSKELKRNDAIYEIQGNRNPFIDYPELVSRISNF